MSLPIVLGVSFACSIVCADRNTAAAVTNSEADEAEVKHSETHVLNTDLPAWETRCYLDDDRPFLVKFNELAIAIEFFPFQWLVYPGTWGAILADNAYVTRQDAQRFYHFVDLARSATQADLEKCVDHLAQASPKERMLYLSVLHLSLDDQYLPVIARHVEGYTEPYPRFFAKEYDSWCKQRARECFRNRVRLVHRIEQKVSSGADLDYFEQRVLRERRRFFRRGGGWLGGTNNICVCSQMRCVSDYALAILSLRGCGLVGSMREMWQFHSASHSEGTDVMKGSRMFQDEARLEKVLGDGAWEEFRTMSFNVRRLRHEYIIEVECVAPTYQGAALAQFEMELAQVQPRIAALACFCIAPDIASDNNKGELLIRDWPTYVRRIPKELVTELLTATNLDVIDADLTYDRHEASNLGYRPYFANFLEYVLRHRDDWFDEAEFAEIEVRLSPLARQAWTNAAEGETEGRRTSPQESQVGQAILRVWSDHSPLRLLDMPDPSQLRGTDGGDPASLVKKEFVAWSERRNRESRFSDIVIDYVKEVKGPASTELFPDHRFFLCQWTEVPIRPMPNGVRFSIATVVDAVVVDTDLRLTLIGPGQRHDRNFGELLAAQKVTITDETSAQLVWNAFCEVRRWRSPSGKIERVSDRLWRLGIQDRDPQELGRAYHEVRLNEDLTVESMGHIIEDANGRRWN